MSPAGRAAYLRDNGPPAWRGRSGQMEIVMFGTSNRIRGLAVAVVTATSLLGACISIPAPGPGGGGEGGGVTPPPPPQESLACHQRVGENEGHGFVDIGRGDCWSCPLGSARTLFPVNENWACNFGGILGTSFAPAEYLGT